ncbi:MAG TPA: Gfo/Idh/MocA family oxidoreductase [Armatimonadota bacterium]|nr:Gfo/Idh/MocA family oxidoreductase [Armatimonadota bacterium]HQK94869.1 Gfo/Idh/MocA family oxidoreductase [Armatimonadota bacterium]
MGAVIARGAWAQATDKKVRIGVVGGGFGASFQWHLDPNCIVAAVSDLRTDRRDYLTQVYQCPTAYESLEKLILDDSLDAVAVFTGAPDHVRHCVAVMDTGKHCICAVPAATSLEECEQLIDAKVRNNVRYMMAETSYYRWPTITMRELYRDGKFGEVLYSEVEYYHPMNDAERNGLWFYNGERTWRYGYPPMLYPTHSTGFLVGVTRERLTKVSCLGYGAPDGPGLSDNAYNNPYSCQAAIFRTSGGHICRCNVMWAIWAHGERAQWMGARMSAFMDGWAGQPYVLKSVDGPDVLGDPNYFERLPEAMRAESGHGGSHPFLTHEFVTALVEDREPAIDVYESVAMTAPGIVAHQSAFKNGEQLEVPSFDPER